jgi:5-(carboxyamino)imidazole ribonucleotide mutase
MNKKVAILIGSETDRPTMEAANKYYDFFGIQYEIHVKSAHRNPSDVEEFAKNARSNGFATLVGAAGMAAHLAGALKANTTLPVIGVPLGGGILDGMDALLSTVQMPKGVPVATVAVGKAGAINAAILSAEIISLYNNEILVRLDEFKLLGAKL